MIKLKPGVYLMTKNDVFSIRNYNKNRVIPAKPEIKANPADTQAYDLRDLEINDTLVDAKPDDVDETELKQSGDSYAIET